MRKKHIHNKFNTIVRKVVSEDTTKKFMVSKISPGKYAYHSFFIEKITDECYECNLNGKTIYSNIVNFQLALSYCYNYLFKKSNVVTKKLNKLNDSAAKQQMDMAHYNHYLKNAKEEERAVMHARINESKLIYKNIKNEIRNLSTSI